MGHRPLYRIRFSSNMCSMTAGVRSRRYMCVHGRGRVRETYTSALYFGVCIFSLYFARRLHDIADFLRLRVFLLKIYFAFV